MGMTWVWAGGTTDRGPRAQNEDSFLSEGPVQIVADGMGGHLGGAAASEAVIDAFKPLTTMNPVRASDVTAAVHKAQEDVEDLAVMLGGESGSTLTGAIAVEHHGQPWWMVINVGDSRVYVVDSGSIAQVTVDHSYVQELVDWGEITPLEARTHPERNIVTRAIGDGQRGFDAWLVPAVPGRRLVIASDGLTNTLADARIASIASLPGEPGAAASQLLDTALGAGVHDNVTVIVVENLDAQTATDADAAPWWHWGVDDMDEDDTTLTGRRQERV